MVTGLTAGMYVAQLAILDDSNYPIGTLVTPNSPVNGTVYTPYLIPAIVEWQPATATYDEATSRAAMKLRGRVDLGVSDFGTGTLILSELDDVFDALVMGSTIDATSASGIRHRARNILRIGTRRFLLMLTTTFTNKDSVVAYNTFYLNNVSFRNPGLAANQTTGVNPNNLSYTVIPRTSTRLPWGQLYSANSVAVTGNADTEGSLVATAPLALATYIDDGAATTFTFPYLPDYSENAGVYNFFFKNGSTNHAGVSAFSTTTGATTHTAGTAADKWVVLAPSTAILSA